MGLPQENEEGYRAGSPINFAEGLQGKLLLIHGTGDDNVHYQGTERLVNLGINSNTLEDGAESGAARPGGPRQDQREAIHAQTSPKGLRKLALVAFGARSIGGA